MKLGAIDESQRKAARIAGFTFLLAMAIVVLANYGINFRLIVPGNAVESLEPFQRPFHGSTNFVSTALLHEFQVAGTE
jgi:hypothetical protein